jgi:hypothetical protein
VAVRFVCPFICHLLSALNCGTTAFKSNTDGCHNNFRGNSNFHRPFWPILLKSYMESFMCITKQYPHFINQLRVSLIDYTEHCCEVCVKCSTLKIRLNTENSVFLQCTLLESETVFIERQQKILQLCDSVSSQVHIIQSLEICFHVITLPFPVLPIKDHEYWMMDWRAQVFSAELPQPREAHWLIFHLKGQRHATLVTKLL